MIQYFFFLQIYQKVIIYYHFRGYILEAKLEEGSINFLFISSVINISVLNDILTFIFILLFLLLLLFSLVSSALIKASRMRLLKIIDEKKRSKFELLLQKCENIKSLTSIGKFLFISVLLVISLYWFTSGFENTTFPAVLLSILIVLCINYNSKFCWSG